MDEVADAAGNKQEYEPKKDKGKPRLDLVPLSPLKLAAEAYGVGAEKYAPNAWLMNPMRWGQVQAALLRHLEAWWSRREEYDPEDGQHHLGAVLFCVFTLAEYQRLARGEDDRPPIEFRQVDQDVPSTRISADEKAKGELADQLRAGNWDDDPVFGPAIHELLRKALDGEVDPNEIIATRVARENGDNLGP